MTTETDEILENLEKMVFAPLNEIRPGISRTLRDHVERHMQDEPIIRFMVCEQLWEDEVTGPNGEKRREWVRGSIEYKLGLPNPVMKSAIIFGMFLWEEAQAVAVYSVEIGGDNTTGNSARYFKTVVKDWKILDAEMSGEATIAEMGWALDLDEIDAANGKPPQRRAQA